MNRLRRYGDRLRALVLGRYLLWMAALAAVASALNFNARAMSGILAYYEDFKRIILARFNPAVATMHAPTFPMWGYGWLLVATDNKIALIIIQNLLALAAYWFFFHSAKRYQFFSPRALDLTKLALVLALPLYAFHAVLWPYSPSFSLLLASFTLLGIALKRRPGHIDFGPLLLSGGVFGLMLNFRSDYCLLPFVIAATLLAVYRGSRASFASSLIWLSSIYVMLVPWALYAHHVSGHYLFTSSNGGMAMYIGLGNLPGNVWRITPVDGDPSVHRIVAEAIGPGTNPLSADADPFLKRETMHLALADKGEYLRRLAYVLWKTLTGGVYQGEFYADASCGEGCRSVFVHRLTAIGLTRLPIAFLTGSLHGLSRVRVIGGMLTGVSYVYGVVTLLASYAAAPFCAFAAWRRRDLLPLLCVAIIAFQTMINVFIYEAAYYSTNAYFMHLLNIGFAVHLLRDRRGSTAAALA